MLTDTKRLFGALLVAVALTGVFFLGSWYGRRGDSVVAGRRVLRYVCPMHPQYTSDKPGDAPCCGMRLEPVYEDSAHGRNGTATTKGEGPSSSLKIDAGQQQAIGIGTAEVQRTSTTHTIRLPGRASADETRIYPLISKVEGWVLELPSISTGSLVKKGQTLVSIYSRDLLVVQQGYILSLNNLDQLKTGELLAPAVQYKLTAREARLNVGNLGLAESQILEITRTREPVTEMYLTSPTDGLVLSRTVYPGQRFERSTEFFRIADLSRIWVLADLFERDSRYVRPGKMVKVLYQGRTFHAQVSEVPPQFDSDSRTLKVRLEMDNPGHALRPGMFVDVEFPVELPTAVTIPADAMIDSGLRKTVYVDRGNGYFEPRLIETGWRFGERVQVTRGLQPGERIVVAGNFLLDSESRMKTAAAGIQAPAKDPVCGMDVDRVKAKAAGRTSQYQGSTYYFCSDQCKRKFDGNPAQYTGVASGQSKEAQGPAVDPVCGMEVDRSDAKAGGRTSQYRGTTYYFCSDHCKKQFDKEPAKYLKKPGGSGHSSGSGGVHI